MGEASQQVQLHIMGPATHSLNSTAQDEKDHDARGGPGNSSDPRALRDEGPDRPTKSEHRRPYGWWLKVAVYSLFVLSGQAVATLLGRQYYDKGGSSKWLATLVQLCGFPILMPYYFPFSSTSSKHPNPNGQQADEVPQTTTGLPPSSPPLRALAFIYVSIGTIVAADCYMYSVGLQYLPVSTYSLICASQLAFNALFSFFLNSQKFTPFIINSLVLLTISSVLLVFQTGSENPAGVTKTKYVIGFICTVGASAGYALVLSLIQLSFKKVIKKGTLRALMDMIIFPCLVATCIIVVALFASGEWKHLTTEMEHYKLGRTSYIMNLVWTAISWQVFSIGSTGLILDASSLFSNAISVLGLPIVPIFAVVLFHDKMDGMKVIAMILAIWGFVSYAYQQYVGDSESKNGARLEIRRSTC